MGWQMASQLLRCPSCDSVQIVLPGIARIACCEEGRLIASAQWEEDVSGRTYVPVLFHPALQDTF
jgi:hypothetical protein